MEKQEPNSVQMIDARAAKLSNYSYPITKSSNWTAVIGYPRDRAAITQKIGAHRTNHERAFCVYISYTTVWQKGRADVSSVSPSMANVHLLSEPGCINRGTVSHEVF